MFWVTIHFYDNLKEDFSLCGLPVFILVGTIFVPILANPHQDFHFGNEDFIQVWKLTMTQTLGRHIMSSA